MKVQEETAENAKPRGNVEFQQAQHENPNPAFAPQL